MGGGRERGGEVHEARKGKEMRGGKKRKGSVAGGLLKPGVCQHVRRKCFFPEMESFLGPALI